MITLVINECTGRNINDDYVVKATLTSDNYRTRDMFKFLYVKLVNDEEERFIEYDFENGMLIVSDILFTDICLVTATLSSEIPEPAVIVADNIFFKEDLLHIAKFYYKIGGNEDA